MRERYFVRVDAEQKGPFTIGQLRSLWNSGVVTGETEYCEETSPDCWLHLRVLESELDEMAGDDQHRDFQPPIMPRAIPRAPMWSPGVALVLSFFIPGLGQMYRGKIGHGIAWLVGVIAGYFVFIIPGVIAHLICLVDAYSGDPNKSG